MDVRTSIKIGTFVPNSTFVTYTRRQQFCANHSPTLPHLQEMEKRHYTIYSLGMCSTTMERYDDSIKYYKQSIQHDPNDVDSRINLAHRLYWKGALDESLKQCNYVLHNLSGITSPYGERKCKEIIDMIESSQ